MEKSRLEKQEYKCNILKDLFGLDCPIGYSNPTVVRNNIQSVSGFIKTNKAIQLNKKYDAVNYLLSSFDIHHIMNTLLKQGMNWMKLPIDELKSELP